MSSITYRIRFTDEVSAKMLDGCTNLKLSTPTTLNDLLRTVVHAGLSVMCGPNWQNEAATNSAHMHLQAITKQLKKSTTSADVVTKALQDHYGQKTKEESIWESIPIEETILILPLVHQDKARRIWSMMSEGHISIKDQLNSENHSISMLASQMLHAHLDKFPKYHELIIDTYNTYFPEG